MNVFRIVTKHGISIDVPPQEGFNFLATCMNVKFSGYFCNENVYIPYENIQFMAFGEPNMAPGVAPVGSSQNAPSSESKQ